MQFARRTVIRLLAYVNICNGKFGLGEQSSERDFSDGAELMREAKTLPGLGNLQQSFIREAKIPILTENNVIKHANAHHVADFLEPPVMSISSGLGAGSPLG